MFEKWNHLRFISGVAKAPEPMPMESKTGHVLSGSPAHRGVCIELRELLGRYSL